MNARIRIRLTPDVVVSAVEALGHRLRRPNPGAQQL